MKFFERIKLIIKESGNSASGEGAIPVEDSELLPDQFPDDSQEVIVKPGAKFTWYEYAREYFPSKRTIRIEAVDIVVKSKLNERKLTDIAIVYDTTTGQHTLVGEPV